MQWNFRKAREIMFVDCVTKGGGHGLVWIIGGVQVVCPPGQKAWFVNRHLPTAIDPLWIEVGPHGYPHTDIVSAKNFQSITSFHGGSYLFFKTRKHNPIEDNPAVGNFDVTVLVDEKSRLPFSATIGEDSYTFQFITVPEEPLVPPPEVLKAMEFETKRINRLNAVPPHA